MPHRRCLSAAIWFAGAWMLALGLSGSAAPVRLHAVPLPDAGLLQVGDWVLRSGIAADSRFIRAVSQSRFSHIGMVVQTTPRVLVAHATTDDDPRHANQVLLAPLADFAAARRADALAIVRPRFLSAGQREAAARYVLARQGQAFVMASRGKNPLYCTTLMWEAIRQQSPAFNPRWQYLDLPLFRGEYLFPQAFLQSDLDWIYSVAAHPVD